MKQRPWPSPSTMQEPAAVRPRQSASVAHAGSQYAVPSTREVHTAPAGHGDVALHGVVHMALAIGTHARPAAQSVVFRQMSPSAWSCSGADGPVARSRHSPGHAVRSPAAARASKAPAARVVSRRCGTGRALAKVTSRCST